MSKEEFEIIKFSYGDIELDIKVSPKENTVWLSIEDMTRLFKKSRTTISKHIKNILQSDIIIENSVSANFAQVHQKFAHTAQDGKTYWVDFYSLDVVTEVGNRTNSEIASIFYNWCIDTLADLNGKNEMKSNLIRYDEFDFYLDVNFVPEENMVYLNQNQIAILFGTTRQNVNMHIKNIDEEGELTIAATCKDFLLVQLEGDRKIERKIQCFNLDMVLAVGYRVKGSRAVAFRRWATKILTPLYGKSPLNIQYSPC